MKPPKTNKTLIFLSLYKKNPNSKKFLYSSICVVRKLDCRVHIVFKTV